MSEGQSAVKPASWVGDSVEEWKKLPPWGKIVVFGIAGAVIFIGYRQWQANRNSPSASGSAATGPNSPSLTDLSQAGSVGNPFNTLGGPGNPIIGAQGPAGPQGIPGITTVVQSAGTPTGTPAPPSPAPKPAVPPTPKLSTYTVVPGDNLSAIAARLGVQGGWQALYNQNKTVVGANPNLIYPGQKLNVAGLK